MGVLRSLDGASSLLAIQPTGSVQDLALSS
jgi:hypothetical protein